MASAFVTRLRLAGTATWDDVRRRLDAIAAGGEHGLEITSLQLIRTAEGSGAMVTQHAESGATPDRLSRVVGEALEPILAEPPEVFGGEILLNVGAAHDDPPDVAAAMDAAARADYFAVEVVRSGGLWGLHGKTWARSPRADGVEALPFWPARRHAAWCVGGPWSTFTPREIPLEEFLDDWLVGMQEDGILAVVFPTPSDAGITLAPADLAQALCKAEEAPSWPS